MINETGANIVDILTRLEGLGFVSSSALTAGPMIQFVHVLTQEVAYSSLLTDHRAGLLEAIGDAICAEGGERLHELLSELATTTITPAMTRKPLSFCV